MNEIINKNILVTGGAGYLGSHLSEKLISLGNNVTILDNFMRGEEAERNIVEIKSNVDNSKLKIFRGDILDFEKVKELVEDKDFIFHLAALPSHRLAMKMPRDYAMADVAGTVNILEAVRLIGQKSPIFFASSNKVYGKNKTPFREDDLPKPEGPYGLSKYCSEQFCEMYAKYYGLDVPTIRYHHVLGPRCQPDRELSIFTESVINGINPIVHGHFENGEFKSCAADYTNVYDVIDATILATANVKGFDVFNVATGKATTVLKIAELIIENLGKKSVKPIFKELLSHETMLHLSDASKIERVLGFRHKLSVETSVKQYIDWRMKVGSRAQAIYKQG